LKGQHVLPQRDLIRLTGRDVVVGGRGQGCLRPGLEVRDIDRFAPVRVPRQAITGSSSIPQRIRLRVSGLESGLPQASRSPACRKKLGKFAPDHGRESISE
jgi:hypothetical protein